MDEYFEYGDRLNAPLEAFCYDASAYYFPILHHWHYFIEIIYLVEGRIFVTSGEHAYVLHPGDLIYFPPKQLHSIDRLPESYQEQHGFLSDFSVSDVHLAWENMQPQPEIQQPGHSTSKRFYAATGIKYHVLKFDLSSITASNRLKNQFGRLSNHVLKYCPEYILFTKNQTSHIPVQELMEKSIHEMSMRNYGYDEIVSSAIITLLTCFSRIWLQNGLALDEILTAPDNRNHIFEQITEYIEIHYKEPLRVQSLAKHCGMSYSYFAKSFRELYGRSCKEYIEFIRINKATDLLLFTNLDLNYISQETGFADCSHLIRTFKKYKGCTPKQWKRKVGTTHEMDS